VGDVEEGDAHLVVDQVQLHEHPLAELQVQRRQRLVQQQHQRLVHQRPGHRHALFLAAADLVGPLVGVPLHLDERQHPVHRLVDFAPGAAGHLQPEADVLTDGQVGEEGVALEDGVDGAAVGRQRGDVLAVEEDPAGVGRLEAGDDAQQGGLAAAAGPEK